MYSITCLKPETQEFLNYLTIGQRPRSLIASIAIAKALSNTLAVPSGQVDNLEMYFRTTCLIDVQAKLSNLNELVLVDAVNIIEYVKKFYMARYLTLNPPRTVCCLKSDTAVEDFLGLSVALDFASLEVVKEAPLEATKIHNGAVYFFEEIAEKLSAV